MVRAKYTLSVTLDAEASNRVEKAAALLSETPAVFLAHAADDAARRVLTDWAVQRYFGTDRTYGQVAEETGLAIEEIMDAIGRLAPDEARRLWVQKDAIVVLGEPSAL